MRETVRIDWMVPTAEWEAFREYVKDEFGEVKGYLGREAEFAMREYADADRFAEIETRLDSLLDAVGYTRDGHSKKIKSELATQETTRVTARVSSEIKDAFKKEAKKSDHPFGVVLASALHVHRDGGRARRLESKLDRIEPDLKQLLAEVTDADDVDGMGHVEKNVVRICSELTDQFTDDDLNTAIHEIAAEGPTASEPTLERYRDLVFDRLDVEPLPNCQNENMVYVPESRAREIAPDQPMEIRRPVSFLNAEEQARRLELTAAKLAIEDNGGQLRMSVSDIRSVVFNNELTAATVKQRIRAATDHIGFYWTSTNGVKKLLIEAADIRDEATGGADTKLAKQARALYQDLSAWSDSVSVTTASDMDRSLTDFRQQPKAATDGGKQRE